MSDTDNNTALTPRKYGFQKGNPGRPPGHNKRTMFLNAIGKKNAHEIVRTTVEAARNGKQWACEAVLARLFPPARSRTVALPMKDIRSLEDIAAAYAGLWAAVSQGLLTPDEAVSLSAMLKDHAAILEISEIDARLVRLEQAEAKRRDCPGVYKKPCRFLLPLVVDLVSFFGWCFSYRTPVGFRTCNLGCVPASAGPKTDLSGTARNRARCRQRLALFFHGSAPAVLAGALPYGRSRAVGCRGPPISFTTW